uniref:Uncharacterized protein n=1 Tax=Anguilla anguilla TaxID=7936 RepID=A0A0E9Q5P8_ANGAN
MVAFCTLPCSEDVDKLNCSSVCWLWCASDTRTSKGYSVTALLRSVLIHGLYLSKYKCFVLVPH